MTVTLTDDDRAIIQSLIDASVKATIGAVGPGNQGLTRNGSVAGYDPSTLIASVTVDGDSTTTDIHNAMAVDLTAGQRVKIMFQDKGGASIIGLAAPLPPVPVVVPTALWRDVQYLLVEADLGTASSTTYNLYGNNGSPSAAGYKIPADGTLTVALVVQGRFTATGEQQVVVSPGTDLTSPATTWAWRAEGGADFGRVNLACMFHAAVTKDQIVLPDFAVAVDTGTPTFYLNGWEAFVDFEPTVLLLPAA